jgi:hypothetical protein
MAREHQSLSLVNLDQEEYDRRVQRSQALAHEAVAHKPKTLTQEEIEAYFKEVERRLTNAILYMPSQPSTPGLVKKRKDLLLDWAFIHNETEKLYLKCPWLCPAPIVVFRRLVPTEKKALEDLKKSFRTNGQADILRFEEELRPFTKFLDQSQPQNAAEILDEIEPKVLQLRIMLDNLQRQIVNWPN